MNKFKIIGFSAAIVCQIFILVGMVVLAALPLWTGTEIKVKTVPVDPRDLFRGNYVRLNYDFSRISSLDISDEQTMRAGELVYVSLEENDSGLYELASASLIKPGSGVFLRGRIERGFFDESRIQYGIEAFFSPKDKALQLEQDLSSGGIATLMVASSGKARIKAVTGLEVIP